MEETKCPSCGGAMTMKCEMDHEHGQVCHMKCEACGHEENAPAAEGESMPEAGSDEPAAM